MYRYYKVKWGLEGGGTPWEMGWGVLFPVKFRNE